LTLSSIYKPVKREIAQVEEKLNQVARTAPPGIAEQINHVLQDGGKQIRPALTLLASKFHYYNLDLLLPIATAIELLHTATLVHDDTIDNSHLRRGKLSINRLWGNLDAVLLGDYLFATSARMAAETGNLRVIKLFAQALMSICSGEIDESLNPADKSREHYFQRIGDKTASLFSAATESGAVLSEAPEEAVQSLKDYGYNLGMGFQIVDDILDFTGRKETIGKPVVSDLSRGILTLPTILLLERPEGDSIKEILEEDKERGKKLIIEGVYKFGVLEECYHIAQGFRSRACLALEPLPRNPAHSSLIGLADHVIRRKR
jgi:geranylgeranyl pyrophosphate synthase